MVSPEVIGDRGDPSGRAREGGLDIALGCESAEGVRDGGAGDALFFRDPASAAHGRARGKSSGEHPVPEEDEELGGCCSLVFVSSVCWRHPESL